MTTEASTRVPIGIEIRKPKRQEMSKIIRLRTKVFFNGKLGRQVYDEEQFADENPNTIHAAAFDGKKLVGTGLIYPNFTPDTDTLHVSAVAVDPDYTRRGIGSAVMDFLETEAAPLGASIINLTAICDAIPFYTSLGYQERPSTQSGNWDKFMFKLLDPASGLNHAR